MQETMLQNRKPVIRSYWLVGACIAVGFIASICIGNYPISIREIISILTGGEVGAMTRKVFFTLRLPRTCMGVMAGAGLGVAGSVYQMIFRNPLAPPISLVFPAVPIWAPPLPSSVSASAWAALRWAPSRAGCLPWRL